MIRRNRISRRYKETFDATQIKEVYELVKKLADLCNGQKSTTVFTALNIMMERM